MSRNYFRPPIETIGELEIQRLGNLSMRILEIFEQPQTIRRIAHKGMLESVVPIGRSLVARQKIRLLQLRETAFQTWPFQQPTG